MQTNYSLSLHNSLKNEFVTPACLRSEQINANSLSFKISSTSISEFLSMFVLLVDKYNDLLRFWNSLYTINAGWGGIVFAHAIALKRPLNMHRLLSDWLERNGSWTAFLGSYRFRSAAAAGSRWLDTPTGRKSATHRAHGALGSHAQVGHFLDDASV